jgi:hypothetical protein
VTDSQGWSIFYQLAPKTSSLARMNEAALEFKQNEAVFYVALCSMLFILHE